MPKKASDFNINSQFSLLLQGPPKSGKTTLALQFPRPYVVDLDNNISGTIRWMRNAGIPLDFTFDTPDVNDDGSERKITERYKFMSKCIAEAALNPDIETIIVDGATKLDMYIKGDIARQKPTIKGEQRRDGQMTLEDWNDHLYMWQNFITKMQLMPKMFILTAHEEFSDVPNLPGVILMALQGKKAQQTVPGMFSDVWRAELQSKPKAGGGVEYEWMVRAMATNTLQLGNSLGLPSSFKMDWKTIRAALDKGAKP